jgi:hypothetical protein
MPLVRRGKALGVAGAMATPMGAALAETQISKEFAFVGPRLTRTTR